MNFTSRLCFAYETEKLTCEVLTVSVNVAALPARIGVEAPSVLHDDAAGARTQGPLHEDGPRARDAAGDAGRAQEQVDHHPLHRGAEVSQTRFVGRAGEGVLFGELTCSVRSEVPLTVKGEIQITTPWTSCRPEMRFFLVWRVSHVSSQAKKWVRVCARASTGVNSFLMISIYVSVQTVGCTAAAVRRFTDLSMFSAFFQNTIDLFYALVPPRTCCIVFVARML